MKTVHIIRHALLTGICAGLMTGCSWLEDWPPKESEMAVKTAPKPPESKIMQTSDGTWLEQDRQAKPVEAKGLALDDASADRIAQLEKSLADLRSDLNTMMPALTKMAEAQTDLQKALGMVEPAAGGMMPPPVAPAPSPYDVQTGAPVPAAYSPPPAAAAAPQPGSVAWYEEQERLKRMAAVQPPAQQAYQPPVPVAAAQPQQAAAAPAPSPYPQQGYQQPQAQPYQPPVQQQMAAAPMPQAAPQQPAPAAYTPPPAAGGGSLFVSNVRFGEHPDKTRMVLDASSKVDFTYDLDNSEKILMIALPGASWQGAQQMAVDGSPLVSSYNVVPDPQGGSQVVMQLKQPVKVLWAQALPPGGPQGDRVVFDLAPL